MTWIHVHNQADIEHLLQTFGYFHDGCLKELHMWADTYVNENLAMTVPSGLDTHVRMLFQRQFNNPSAIELLFEEVTGLHIHPSAENHDSIIYDAIVLQHEGHFYWANHYNWHPQTSSLHNIHWISAKKLKWREVSDWMGPQQRYGVQDNQ
ncbi:hypothetical protein [Lysinibacillus piscis]|uniref:Nuclear transport factor 2 family protein n=1 Tax=Lysinibacillus piscis TaxID=2518931 RepID=A0ABQ5NP61_9BACI|nr:hypothetical protein [Lysinibacillus sp. KH24]GLC90145.1 hypothetical protein LYSBPC_32720 [Lysinibacillus sp. KH24]